MYIPHVILHDYNKNRVSINVYLESNETIGNIIKTSIAQLDKYYRFNYMQ